MCWCAASSNGNGQQVVAKWLSITNHVRNVHEGHSEAFPRYAHGPLQEGRKWLRRGKTNKLLANFCGMALPGTLWIPLQQIIKLITSTGHLP